MADIHHDVHDIDDHTTWRNLAMVVATLVGVMFGLMVVVSIVI